MTRSPWAAIHRDLRLELCRRAKGRTVPLLQATATVPISSQQNGWRFLIAVRADVPYVSTVHTELLCHERARPSQRRLELPVLVSSGQKPHVKLLPDPRNGLNRSGEDTRISQLPWRVHTNMCHLVLVLQQMVHQFLHLRNRRPKGNVDLWPFLLPFESFKLHDHRRRHSDFATFA